MARFFRARGYAGPLLISAALCLSSLALYTFTWLLPRPGAAFELLKDIEARTLDLRFRLRGPRKPSPAVAIVAIDQKSEDVLGRWPFPRSVFADTLDFLREAGARVVSLDIDFPEPDQNSALTVLGELRQSFGGDPRFAARLEELRKASDNDQKFSDAIARFNNTILGYFFLFDREEMLAQNKQTVGDFLNYLSFQAYPRVIRPRAGLTFDGLTAVGVSPDLPRFAENAKNFGFFNVLPDSDGTVRSEPIVVRFENGWYPSLDIATVLAWTNEPLDKVAVVFDEGGLARVDLGSVRVPVDSAGMVRIDFCGPAGTYPTWSIADVVRRRLPPSAFRDRIVLIGPTATGIADTRPTPFEKTAFPGVEVHANFIDNLLHGNFIRRGLRENFIDMAILVLFSLPLGLLVRALGALRSALLLLAIAAGFCFFTYEQFSRHGVWLALFLPLATMLAGYTSVVSYSYFFEEREKKVVRGAFQQYMAPEVISQLLDRPELLRLGGEEKQLTAMFADIRGFTSLSEGLTAAALVELLNEYLSEMTDVIFREKGTLDKYIGDAVMAFWGAPLEMSDHAGHACRAALEMSRALDGLQRRWREQGRPRIDIGIGLNTGAMMVGNMGSARRFNYTVMGDNVNLASRLEGATRTFNVRIILSEATWEQLHGTMVTRELDMIRVKGKSRPVRIYELLGTLAEQAQYADLIARFEQALELYRRANWSAALDGFGRLHRDYPQDGPSRIFAERCAAFLEHPPEGAWDGVYEMKTK